MRDSAWYYIACGGCKTKATKGPTTLMCKKCGKAEITGAAEEELYLLLFFCHIQLQHSLLMCL